MSRVLAVVLLIAVLAVGGGIVATTAYQAGLSAAVTTTAGAVPGQVIVPAYAAGYGFGWHPYGGGFGFFGFLGTLLFLFIVFGLIRAIAFRGGPRHRGGWGGGQGRSPWEDRAHDTFERWHQGAHAEPSDRPASSPSTPPNPANPA
jgi:hypothetical protein